VHKVHNDIRYKVRYKVSNSDIIIV
jgi:hypothetical protein